MAELRGHAHTILYPALLLWLIAALLSNVGHWAGADVLEYKAYAQAALHTPLLHHLPKEYPAPALVLFVVPLVLPFAYPWVFAVLVGLVLIGLLFSYRDNAMPSLDLRSVQRLIVYLTVGAAVVLAARYDLFAAACAFLALRAAKRNSWTSAWTWSSAGFLLKLFPAVLWPVLLIAEFRKTGRIPKNRLLWIVGSAALLIAIPAIFDRSALFSEVHYYFHRPPTVEGFASGLSLLMDWHAWHFFYGYGSVNPANLIVGAMATSITLVAVAGIFATYWAQAKNWINLEVACLLSLTLLVLGMKVLSAQYLLWLMPFWALYRLRGLWVLACVANTAVFAFSTTAKDYGYISPHGWATTLTLIFLFRDITIAAGTFGWLHEQLGPKRLVKSGPSRDPTTSPSFAASRRLARDSEAATSRAQSI